jgi:hypothetical protein
VVPVREIVALGLQTAGALAVAGLFLRGHARYCKAFAAYLTAGIAYVGLTLLWPERFFVLSFWEVAQVTFDLLKVMVALELGYWIFLGFPGAASRARGTLFLLLVGILVAVLMLPETGDDAYASQAVARLCLSLETTATVMITAVTFLVLWYRIPLHPIHRAIMVGLVPYVTVFTTVLRFVTLYGWESHLVAAEPFAHLAACIWWARAAWRPAPEVEPVIAFLQPWRARQTGQAVGAPSDAGL